MSLEPQRPRFGPIPSALRYCGVSRSRLYQWARKNPQLIRKNGRASLVDLDILDRVLDELPLANLKAPPSDEGAA
jgi:hypothetical protein